jgi:hypothetical protein
MELKFLIPDRIIPSIIERIAPYTQSDPYLLEEGKGRSSYPVNSLYFDSLDFQALCEKEAGILSRRKVRLRTYEDYFSKDSKPFLEIKRRHDFIVSKDRISLPSGVLSKVSSSDFLLGELLDRAEESEVLNEARLLNSWYGLQPTTFVSYERTPFVGLQDLRFRITFDSNLAGSWRPSSFLGEQQLHACHPGQSVLELKCNHSIPAWFHDIVQEFQFNRVSHSKYALVTREFLAISSV